ncbi:hypothetical protein [Aeromonas caviae]|uniref:hypothetical protein n=1 Tax=Aeromonas caviae TaxID=648 RepID=UPI002B494670|nr:hypothetical protein [Aeromonas caviae]
MGSSGSGRFSDYPGTKATKIVGDGVGIAGGESGTDRCLKAFSTLLEEVGNSDYYSKFHKVPSVGEQVKIIFNKNRLFAVDINGIEIGALPTYLNYLFACMNDGVNYIGLVSHSAATPVPTVTTDFTPS